MGRGPAATVAGLLALLCVGVLGAWGYFWSLGLGCSDEERAAYEEFPQFGGKEVEAGTNEESGACWARYETSAPRGEVQDYYVRNLRRNGWEITLQPSPEELAPPEETVMLQTVPGNPEETREVMVGDSGDLVLAERDGFYYEVGYYSLRDMIEPRPGIEIIVQVGEI